MSEITQKSPQVKGQDNAEQQHHVQSKPKNTESDLNSVGLSDGLNRDPLTEDPLGGNQSSTEQSVEETQDTEPEKNKHGLLEKPGQMVRERASEEMNMRSEFSCLSIDPAQDAEEQALVKRINVIFNDVNSDRLQYLLDYYEESLATPVAGTGAATALANQVGANHSVTSNGRSGNLYDDITTMEKFGHSAFEGDFQDTGKRSTKLPSGEHALHSYDESKHSSALFNAQQTETDIDLHAIPIKEYARFEDARSRALYVPQYGFPERKPQFHPKEIYRGHIYEPVYKTGVLNFTNPSKELRTTKTSLGDALFRGGAKRLKGKGNKKQKILGYRKVEGFWIGDSTNFQRLPENQKSLETHLARNHKYYTEMQSYCDKRAQFIKDFQPFLKQLD